MPSPLVAILELGANVPFVAAWLLMAFGIGWPARRILRPAAELEGVVQLGAGIGVALALDALLGWAGLLAPAGAWVVVAAGCALGVASLWRDRPRCHTTGALALAAAPSVAVLLLASASAPGWLWSTEFGGYDALSYHLELPKAWLVDGAMGASPHNVYGHLPSFMEAAYLHLMALRAAVSGTPAIADAAIGSAVACQMLHAAFALLAAWAVGQAAAEWQDELDDAGRQARLASGAATALVAITPWVVVVGSLAYNEMAVVLLLATGTALVGPRAADASSASAARRAALVGLLAGAACGAKPTAAGFASLPLALLLLWSLPPRRWPAAAAAGLVAATTILSPWLIRNASTVGNPLFPFALELLGRGPWSAEQATTFAHGHASDLGSAARLGRLVSQLLLFGIGPNPQPGEPWSPQWSLLPWLALPALVAVALRRRAVAGRIACVLGVQLAFWLAATHLQSRFLVPALVPMAIAGALGVAAVAEAWPARRRAIATAAALVLGAVSLVPAAIYRRERGGMPSVAIGAEAIFLGVGPPGSGAEDNPAHWLNQALPVGSRVLLVGDARPFWYRGRPAAYVWQTTWDRGPMSAVLAAHDSPAERIAALRTAGFTHVLVDPAMLDRWARSGWGDPLLVPENLRWIAAPPNRVLQSFPGGAVLVELAGG